VFEEQGFFLLAFKEDKVNRKYSIKKNDSSRSKKRLTYLN
jgi:hypothetical protein